MLSCHLLPTVTRCNPWMTLIVFLLDKRVAPDGERRMQLLPLMLQKPLLLHDEATKQKDAKAHIVLNYSPSLCIFRFQYTIDLLVAK